MFSLRTNWPTEKNPLMSLLEDLKAQKAEIFDLTESNPTRAGFRYPKFQILKSFCKPQNLLYHPEPFGNVKAREAVSKMYQRQGISIDPSQVMLTASSSEAYSFLFRLLLNPGDAVLFPQPSYPLFDFLTQLNDAQMDFYPLSYEGQWKIDKEAFQSAVTNKTKAVTLVSPNNPTGCFIKDEELKFVNEACRKNDMAIICDEVFLDYVFERKGEAKSLAGNKEVLTFTLGGLSKSLGLPQMKVSWTIVSGPAGQVQEALKRLEIIADTYLSVNTPCQNALGDWLMLKDKIQKQIKVRIEKNKKALGAFCQKAPLKLLHSDGGWYGILELPSGACEETWALDLLQKHHVFVHPGYFFDFSQGAHIILSYLTPENIFREGLERILKYSVTFC